MMVSAEVSPPSLSSKRDVLKSYAEAILEVPEAPWAAGDKQWLDSGSPLTARRGIQAQREGKAVEIERK
jgi:hypothetical protein